MCSCFLTPKIIFVFNSSLFPPLQYPTTIRLLLNTHWVHKRVSLFRSNQDSCPVAAASQHSHLPNRQNLIPSLSGSRRGWERQPNVLHHTRRARTSTRHRKCAPCGDSCKVWRFQVSPNKSQLATTGSGDGIGEAVESVPVQTGTTDLRRVLTL